MCTFKRKVLFMNSLDMIKHGILVDFLYGTVGADILAVGILDILPSCSGFRSIRGSVSAKIGTREIGRHHDCIE